MPAFPGRRRMAPLGGMPAGLPARLRVSLGDGRCHGVEVTGGCSSLEHSCEGRQGPGEEVARPRHCDDLEHCGAVSSTEHSERFFALLRVNRERAVGKPEPIRQINDLDDATDDFDEPEGERGAHRHDRIDARRPIGAHNKPGTAVDLPRPDGVDRLVEDSVGCADDAGPSIESITRWSFECARDTDRGVRQRVKSPRVHEGSEVIGGWTG